MSTERPSHDRAPTSSDRGRTAIARCPTGAGSTRRQVPVKGVHAITENREGQIVLLTNEVQNNIITYSKDGTFVAKRENRFPAAHALEFDQRGGERLWVTDHQLSVDLADHAGWPGERRSSPLRFRRASGPEAKYHATNVAVMPGGDFYIMTATARIHPPLSIPRASTVRIVRRCGHGAGELEAATRDLAGHPPGPRRAARLRPRERHAQVVHAKARARADDRRARLAAEQRRCDGQQSHRHREPERDDPDPGRDPTASSRSSAARRRVRDGLLSPLVSSATTPFIHPTMSTSTRQVRLYVAQWRLQPELPAEVRPREELRSTSPWGLGPRRRVRGFRQTALPPPPRGRRPGR